MSKEAALFLLVVVGVIVLWGALTGWTFSGRLPQEGAKCTPDEGSKDENSDEYIYNADKECLIVNTCKEGWKPNSSNTACISTLSGDTCTGAVENGIYKYDTSGECVFDSCVTGFEKSGTECISTLSDEPPLDTEDYETPLNVAGGVIYLDRHDVSCKNGALNQFKLNKADKKMQYKYKCVEGIPGYSLGTPLNVEPFVTTVRNQDYRNLENINVDCGTKPIGRFQLARGYTDGSTTDMRDISYNYTCLNNDVNSSTCQAKTTEPSESGGHGILTSSDVSCEDNKVITQFELKKNDENKFYYEYTCCDPN
jgi:hypothetical protein